MEYKERPHTRDSERDILGVCRVCAKEKNLRWIKHPGRKGGGYHDSQCRECKSTKERTRRNSQITTKEMIAKQCSKCKKHKDHRWIRDVRNTKGGYYQHICYDCHTDSTRFHWHDVKIAAIAYLGGKCIDCGLEDRCPSVYDFHHRDPLLKKFNIGSLVKGRSVRQIDDIKPELDKCDLLCVLCHRRRHSRHECCRRRK